MSLWSSLLFKDERSIDQYRQQTFPEIQRKTGFFNKKHIGTHAKHIQEISETDTDMLA